MKINKKFFLFIPLISIFLVSCIGSSITSIAGNAVISEKGIKKSLKDAIIYTKVKTLIFNLKDIKITEITVNVEQGKVLLIGIIKDEISRLSLIKKVWAIEGVEEIYNEIKVNVKYSIFEKTKDLYLASKIKTFLLFDTRIYSDNYSIQSFKGVVYLIGITRNFEEIVLIEDYIKNISGVKKLKSIITHVNKKI